MTDRILLEGIVASGRHGALDGERVEAQVFEIDVQVETDLSGLADDLGRALDYRLLAAGVREVVEGSSFMLVESLAEAIAERLLAIGGSTVRVLVRKPGAASAMSVSAVGVEVVRSR